jgi:MFS family permease
VGCAVFSVINGKMLDRNYRKVATQIGFIIDRKGGDNLRNFPIERARLEIIWPILSFGLACLLCYGWVLEKNANLAAPLILQFLIGLCVNGAFNILSTLVVDLYPQSPSTATAANNLVRCLFGAAGTGITNSMYNFAVLDYVSGAASNQVLPLAHFTGFQFFKRRNANQLFVKS